MKFRSTAFTAMVATAGHTTSAWMGPLQHQHRQHHSLVSSIPTSVPRSQVSFYSTTTRTSLKMAVAEDILDPPQTSATETERSAAGKPIAKGPIISAFRGGLVAVRVDDDLSTDFFDPEVVDTTQLLPKPKATSNNLGGDLIGRQVQFENGQRGVVIVHRPPVVFVYAEDDGQSSLPAEGTVTVFSNLLSIQVPVDNLQQIDCFGRTKNDFSSIIDNNNTFERPIFAPIPQVKDIALINKPLVTGVTMFDALAPIGKGQNMLLIGHDMEDIRRYVTDILSIQTQQGTKCIYAATGGTDERQQVKGLLASAGLEENVVVVMSQDSDKDDASRAAEATVVAASACAIAESFAKEQGLDTLVIVDNIDQHKKIWDTTTRVLVDEFGVDAVVKGDRDGGASSEMRAFFSSLVQRSAQFKKNRGGGSVTLLLLQSIPKMKSENEEEIIFSPEDFEQSPDKVKERINLLIQKKIPLTAANLRKIQIPVPSADEGMRRLVLQHVDDLISMSDGQIWLDERLEQSGRCPAMDFQRSVTRIGIGADTVSRADAAAMRRVVEGLRLDLSQAESMDGADVATTASKKQMRNAQAWLLAMHQPSASGARKLSESCVAMLAASTGAFNDSIDSGMLPGSVEGDTLVRNLLEHVSTKVPEAMAEIDTTQDFTTETKEVITKAIESYFDEK
ncbi:F0F1 ATP synthase subunit alpha [Nitzschia inconspicua]|uniref:F0F1 ATP synthase subunit alpha n=1 Tax=Nitzschia inconspicua TaxID=303405 RepID=A0A9K3LF53_9STRA|nr:F0F1 ATP synthase subunit alpha [Nitzschia inconspicua]